MRTDKRMNLTIKSVAALDPSEGDRVVYDTKLPGFGVRVSKGGTKAFLIKYKLRHCKQRMMTLGKLGDDLTVDQARKRAQQARGLVSQGIDPQIHRDREAAGGTMATAWAAYVADRSRFPFGKRGAWKPRTKHEVEAVWRRYIGPQLGKRMTASITRHDIEALRDDILDGKLNKEHRFTNKVRRKGSHATARLVVTHLSGFFTWCRHKDLYDPWNPAKGVAVSEIKARERVLNDHEFKAFMAALDAYDGNVFAIGALKLLTFTACRSTEVMTLKWSDVMLEGGYLRLKDAKGGDRNVPLTDAAVEVLRSLPRLPGNPYVICGEKPGSHMVNIRKTFDAVLKSANIEGVSIHDIRRTFGSQCLAAGVDIYQLSKLLGHASVTTTERAYAFLPKDMLHSASRRVGERMRDAAAGTLPSNVIPLRGRAS